MPLTIPTLDSLIKRIQTDFDTSVDDLEPRLGFGYANVTIRALAGLTFGLYNNLAKVSRDIFISQASPEGVKVHGETYKVPLKVATAARGNVTFSGTNGSSVLQGTILQRADGVRYVVQQSVTLSGGTATTLVQAETVGVATNLDAGAQLLLVSPVGGVNASATAGALTGGTDTEDIESYRERILDERRNPSLGGTQADYVKWTRQVPGVTRAWCQPEIFGPMTVGVRFAMDNNYVGGIPQSADVTAVATYLENFRPIGAQVSVIAPTPQPVNFTLSITPDTPEVRAAIEASLRALIQRESAPGATLLISRLREAISTSAGESDNVLASPSANVPATSANHLHTMGAITWTS